MGARNPPSDLPSGSLDELPDQQRYALARQFEDVWDIDTYDAPPDFGAKFSVGNTIGNFGYLLGGLYKNDWKARTELQQTLENTGSTDDPELATQNLFPDVERDRFTSRLSGFLSSALYLPDEHKMNLTAFVSRRAQDETLIQVASPENGGVVSNQNPETTWVQNRIKYIEDQVLDILQPDIGLAGGLTETKKIATYAETYNLGVAPHNCAGPVATAAAVQLDASMTNFTASSSL